MWLDGGLPPASMLASPCYVCPHLVKGAWQLSGTSFIKSTDSIHNSSALMI